MTTLSVPAITLRVETNNNRGGGRGATECMGATWATGDKTVALSQQETRSEVAERDRVKDRKDRTVTAQDQTVTANTADKIWGS